MSEETSVFEELKELLETLTKGESKAGGTIGGARQLHVRLPAMANYAAERWLGDLLEIGCQSGSTTVKLAKIAREHDRRIIAVDPWEIGTQNCTGEEFEEFSRKMEPCEDILDLVHLSSMDERAISFIKSRPLCFAYIDGLHTYEACFSDIQAASHCSGIIVVDDVFFLVQVFKAFLDAAYLTGRFHIHHPLCREGYLLPLQGV